MQYGWMNERESMIEMVKFNPNQKDYYHFLSIRAIGEAFGYNEYDQLMPLKDFMDSPVDIIDDLLSGVAAGKKRAKEEAARAAKAKLGNKGNDPMNQLPKNILKDIK